MQAFNRNVICKVEVTLAIIASQNSGIKNRMLFAIVNPA